MMPCTPPVPPGVRCLAHELSFFVACLHWQVNDKCLAVLATTLDIQYLDVSGCASLTEAGFLQLLHFPKLHTLVARATQITDYAISNVLLVIEGLLHLDVSYCPRVSNNALVRLADLLRCKAVPHPGSHIDRSPLAFKIMASCVSSKTAPLGTAGTLLPLIDTYITHPLCDVLCCVRKGVCECVPFISVD
jgi:hypothetical protein